MSYDHTTIGSDSFERFLAGVEAMGGVPSPVVGDLPRGATRVQSFVSPLGETMLVEEYLSVDDRDSDGTSRLSTVCYRVGQRPTLYQQVYTDAYPHEGYLAGISGDELFEVQDHYVDLATGERHLGHAPTHQPVDSE